MIWANEAAMGPAIDTRIEDRFVTVDGLDIRYLEQGAAGEFHRLTTGFLAGSPGES